MKDTRDLRSTSLAIACLAGAVMAFELALIRIYSFLTWYHFAFMVISVALLGFAASGVALQLRPNLARPPRRRAAAYAGLFALTSLGAVLAVSWLPFNLTTIADDPVQVVRLLLNYLILLVPFTCAGLAIATLLGGHIARVGMLYGCDLVGAAMGCLAMVAATGWLGIEGVLTAAAALAAVSAWLLARPGDGGTSRSAWTWAAIAVVLALLTPAAASWRAIPVGPGKTFETVLASSSDARITFTRWSALFRTDVIEGTTTVPWITNPFARVAVPQQHQIIIDGDAMTPIIRLADSDSDSLAFLDYTLPTLALQALHPQRVLVIGAGGGVDVLAALHHGARQVDAVELNPDIVRLVTETHAEWNDGLFHRDEVTLHVDEGRSFVRRSQDRFDLIQLSLVDTWASSVAGAYSLAEGYLYTVEAFEDYLTHLDDDGVLSISRWLMKPPRETLRLVTVAIAALEKLGVAKPEQHILVAANDRISSTLIKRSPFTRDELEAAKEVGRQRSFSMLYLPGETAKPLESDKVIAAQVFNEYLSTADRDAFHAGYPFDVSPTPDDRPFFFQFSRWRQPGAAGFTGKWILLAIFAQALVLSLLLLILPFVRRRDRRQAMRGEATTIGYFLLLGIAFMLLEIALMQRFSLYLGHPVYSIALVLAVLLLGAGAGSLSASRLAPRGRRPEAVFGALIATAGLYSVLLPAVFQATLGWALPARMAFSILLLLPIAFLLGIPFPAAVARLEGRGDFPVGWAWAANGCGSVLGPLIAMLLAIDLGYQRVMLIAAVLYGAAYLVFRRRWTEPAPAAL